MKEILIDCSPGIAGDMLLSALYDLGVPKAIFEQTLNQIGLENFYSLNFEESKSCSIRGIKAKIKIKQKSHKRDCKSIKSLIMKSKLRISLKENILSVFETLANAEAVVHGIKSEDVHFHEIGAIDSLVDIIGVCAAIDYLKPKKIYCNTPSLGGGFVKTEHGRISIPSPAVIELIKASKINCNISYRDEDGELSTPTGIALLLNLVDSFHIPNHFSLIAYGVGIGNRNLPYPNLSRVLEINTNISSNTKKSNHNKYEEVIIQEAWIDDNTPEDIASFVEILRESGAYDVAYYPISMKKNRIGFSIKVILPVNKEPIFRNLWFENTTTLGIREKREGRWILLRREGECTTELGVIKCKQVHQNDGQFIIKPENDEILRLQKEKNKPASEIRRVFHNTKREFKPTQDWQ